MKVKRSWDLISDERRKNTIESIMRFFETELDQKIGVITSESLLDFVLENVSHDIYNKGVSDLTTLLEERFHDLCIDMEVLKKGL